MKAVFTNEEVDVMAKALDLYSGTIFYFLDDYEALDVKYSVERIKDKIIQCMEEENDNEAD